MRAQTLELLPCDSFRLVAEIGTDWERDERERREHDRLIERLQRAQLALPILDNTDKRTNQ